MERIGLIQSGVVNKYEGGDGLTLQYMGSLEFEKGDQAKSLERITASRIIRWPAMINVAGYDVITVFFVAGMGFLFEQYKILLSDFINEDLWNPEARDPSCLKRIVQEKVEASPHSHWIVNAWFDFQNDVLFTLGEEESKILENAVRFKRVAEGYLKHLGKEHLAFSR